ncbi:MAG: hypothetical protein JXN65_08445 [Clostridia bacterium]|nr:hypothetical protein [Clostridia bacterium]
MLSVFLFALGLSACLATPDNQVVIPKSNTEQEIIKSAEEYNDANLIEFEYSVPEHVEDRYVLAQDKLEMVIDADVIMPDISRIPVAKVAPDTITQEMADRIRNYFTQDGVLMNDSVYTKSDFDKMIIAAELEYQQSESDEPIYMDGIEIIEFYMQEREKAPEECIQEAITDYSIFTESGLSGTVVVDGEEKAHLTMKETYIFYQTFSYYWLAERKQYDILDNEMIFTQKEIDFTQEQAMEIAEDFFGQIGIENMGLNGSDKIYYDGEGEGLDIECGGYVLYFSCMFGGLLPPREAGMSMSPNDNFDVSPPVDIESVEIAINEYGEITQFTWRNPIKIVDTLTEHVEILPFDEIMERLKEWSQIQFAYMSNFYTEGLMIKDVYEIRLGLYYMPIRNNPNEFMYAPCWFFVYKETLEYTDEQIVRMNELGIHMQSWDEELDYYFIFSAVDGASVSVYSQETIDKFSQLD